MNVEIINSRTAFDKGLTRYFTGKECSKGHITERMISNGSCIECLKSQRAYQRVKEWRAKNPGSRAEEARRWRIKYPEKAKKIKENYRNRNIEKVRKRERENAKRLRAINPEKERTRIERFKTKADIKRIANAGRPKPDLCEVCNEFNFRIVFDHCHAVGLFRGWICDRCNKVLGLLKDDVLLFRKLASYLENFNDKIDI